MGGYWQHAGTLTTPRPAAIRGPKWKWDPGGTTARNEGGMKAGERTGGAPGPLQPRLPGERAGVEGAPVSSPGLSRDLPQAGPPVVASTQWEPARDPVPDQQFSSSKVAWTPLTCIELTKSPTRGNSRECQPLNLSFPFKLFTKYMSPPPPPPPRHHSPKHFRFLTKRASALSAGWSGTGLVPGRCGAGASRLLCEDTPVTPISLTRKQE